MLDAPREAPAPAPVPAGAARVTQRTLANGLQIVVAEDHRAPVATHMIWYRAGAADEPPRKSGIAHFLEHLMFKGTEAHPAGEFSKVVADFGGQENAFTSWDYTAYFQSVAKTHLPTVMAFEADRMRGLVLTDEVVGPERDVVLEERRMRVDSDPAAQLDEALYAALYVSHPYGVPIIGWEHEVEGLSREDALAFYRRHYAPSNAVLVVTGDVDPDEVEAIARDTYGRVPAGEPLPPRLRPREPAPVAQRRVVLRDAKVHQPSLQRAYLVPSQLTAAPGEAEALQLLAQLLGAASTGRLHRRLCVEQGLAVEAGAWYFGGAIDDTRFGLHATPTDGTSMEALETALDAVVAEIARGGVTEAELARAKTRFVATAIYGRDGPAALARVYGGALALGLSPEHVEEWPARIEAVTAEAVREAAAKHLRPNRAATGLLLPEAETEAPAEAAEPAPLAA